jgi:hypothetical protein
MVRGTADPSATLGMTKGRATLPWIAVAGQKAFFITLGAEKSAAVAFVIPSVAEGSAVPLHPYQTRMEAPSPRKSIVIPTGAHPDFLPRCTRENRERPSP